MRRSFLFKIKVALVWIVVVLLSIDSATACRWLSALRARRASHHCCWSPCAPVEYSCCPTVQKGGVVQKVPGPVQKGEMLDILPEAEEPMVEPPPAVEPPDESEDLEPAPAEPPAVDVEEPEVQPVEKPEEAEEPKPKAKAKKAPAATKPEVEEALDDLFSDQPGEPPAEPTEPEETPAPAEPKETEPAPAKKPASGESLDDLFGPPAEAKEAPAIPAVEPEETPAPVEPAETAPAADAMDDLFGPPAEPAETPAPAEPTEATPAADAVDDLFGPPAEPAETTPAPDAKPAPSAPLDDLFGAPAEPAEATPAPADAPAPGESLDDLFGPTTEEKPAAAPKAAPADDGPLDDLFAPQPEAPAPADDPFGTSRRENHELPMRTWVDNTGTYQVHARLIVIMDDAVRLLKEKGTTTTVPMRRLSDADAQYVQQLVLQYGQGEFARFAAR